MKTKIKCFKKRIISAVMALMMLLGCCGYTFVQSDIAKAAMSSPMRINKDGDIVWGTTSHANPDSGKRFHTTGWNFTIIRDGKTYKQEKVMLTDKSKIKTTGSSDSGSMSYVFYGIKDDYSEDYDYKLIANAIVEFRDYSKGGTLIGTATTKAQADSLATKCSMSHGPYFNDGYFNQQVKWDGDPDTAYNLKGKCDDGLTNPKIDGSRCGSTKSNYVAKWVKKGSTPKMTVDAKTKNNLKGYAFKAGRNSRMAVTNDQGGSGDSNPVNKNMTVNMTSDALKVRVHFYVNGKNIGYQDFVYDEGDQFGTTTKLNFFDDYPDITKWYTNKDGESGTSFKVNQDVNNTVMMKLFNLNGKWKVEDANNNNRHEINLYSNADTIDPPDKEHYNIIYNGNGATSGTMDAQTAPKNISTMLSNIKYKKTGYHTSKTNTWKSKNKGVYYNNCQTVSYDTIDMDDSTKTKVTLYAQWKPNKCTIQYNGNGATSGAVGDQTITYDKWTQSIRSNSYKKNGKNPDANWNTKPDGSGTSIKAGTKIDASVYKKLFGSASADGKTVTLYAQWSGKVTIEEEDPDVKPVGQLSLTYKSGSDFGGESDGPFGYDINGNVTIKDCIFGEKYDTDTPKVYKYETGIDDVYEEQDYLIRAGSTIYEKYNKYFRFMGWSVDTNAIWSKSQSVIDYPNGVKSGKDLAYLYYGYKHPAKSNPAWNSSDFASPVPKPLAALNPVDTASRASQILESKNAWIEYEKVLNREITTQTQKRDEEKAKMNQIKEEMSDVKKQIDSVYYPSTPSVSYPSPLPSKPTKAQQKAYDEAVAAYNRAWDNYYSDVAYANRKKGNLQDQYDTLKKKYEMHKKLFEDAQKKLNAAVSSLNTFNAELTSENNNPNGTYLYAVWDQFPEFINMDEISISEKDIDKVTDEWLLNHVTVMDREDGRLTNGTDVVVENFNKSELKKLQHTGAVSVTFRATDSAGNVTRYTVNIWVNDEDPLEPKDLVGKLYYEASDTRGIRRESFEIGDPSSPNYYGKGYSGTTTRDDGTLVPIYLYVGGLHPESKWYTDPALKKEVYEGFANEENNTPEEVWEFSHQDVLDTQKFIKENGIGDFEKVGSLDKWFEKFKKCRTQCRVTY